MTRRLLLVEDRGDAVGTPVGVGGAVATAFEGAGWRVARAGLPAAPGGAGSTSGPTSELATEAPDALVVVPTWSGTGALLDAPAALWAEAVGVNVERVVYALQATTRAMVERGRGGTVLVPLHAAGLAPLRGLGVLGTTHAALRALLKMVAVELAPHGIGVLGVASGPPLAPMPEGEGARARLRDDTPHPPSAEGVAALCLRLVGEPALLMTGRTLEADGGFGLTRGAGPSPFAERDG